MTVDARRLVLPLGIVLGALAGELAFTALTAAVAPVAGVGVALGVGVATVAFVDRIVAPRIAGVALSRAQLAVAAALALACLVQTGRQAAFMLHPEDPSASVQPNNVWLSHHSCFTAYYEAARFVHDMPNIYEPLLYQHDRPRRLEGFDVDIYEYPPPFLVAVRGGVALGLGFLKARAVWFAFETALVASALVAAALQLGGRAALRFALAAPLVYLAVPSQVASQMGNFQPAALALTVLALVLFARGRELAGSALLSFVILSKLFPGILLVPFAARRQWRRVALTLAACAAWAVVSVAVVGLAPWRAFIDFQLPRIFTGNAFGMLHIPLVSAINHSVFGIPLRLAIFGIGSASFTHASLAAWVYSALLVALAWLVAKKLDEPTQAEDAPARELLAGVLLVAMTTYRAPFLPQEYAAIGPVWVVALLAAVMRPAHATWAGLAASWLLLQVLAPFDPVTAPSVSPATLALICAVPQLAAAATFAWATWWLIRRAPSRA